MNENAHVASRCLHSLSRMYVRACPEKGKKMGERHCHPPDQCGNNTRDLNTGPFYLPPSFSGIGPRLDLDAGWERKLFRFFFFGYKYGSYCCLFSYFFFYSIFFLFSFSRVNNLLIRKRRLYFGWVRLGK